MKMTRNDLIVTLNEMGTDEEMNYLTGNIDYALWAFNGGELDGVMISGWSDEAKEYGTRDVDHNQILSIAGYDNYYDMQNELDLIRIVPEGHMVMVTPEQHLTSDTKYYLDKMGYDIKVYEEV